MANTLKFGNGQWATGNGTALAYNDENANFKPLPFDFTRASSGTTVNQSGLIETVGSGIPRIDFQGNTKGALLLEPSRSNSINYSEDFNQSVWNKTGLTVSSNQIISPDGSLNADEINITGVNAHYLFDVISVNASTNYVLTFYAKKGTATDVSYSIYDSSNGADIIASTSYYSQISNTNWTRITVEFTTPSGCTSVRPYPLRDGSSAGTVYIWGAQLEQGSYPTSYIRTSGSAVTRVADACDNGGNDQVINSSEGVLFLDFEITENSTEVKQTALCNGTTSEAVKILQLSGSTSFRFETVMSSGTNFQKNLTLNPYQRNKCALQYKANDYKVFVNGVKQTVTQRSTVPVNLDRFNFNRGVSSADNFFGNIRDVRVYNTALTDAELIALTT